MVDANSPAAAGGGIYYCTEGRGHSKWVVISQILAKQHMIEAFAPAFVLWPVMEQKAVLRHPKRDR